jgi:hypothetical protein
MQTKSMLLTLSLFLLGSHEASAQVSVRIGAGGYYPPPRAYYGPRYYYPPRPVVVYPAPVIVAPRPVYYAPRPVYYAPRPYHGYRGHGRGRRW